MIILRYLFFPFSILYWIITSVRNYLFDIGILKSYTFDVPIIVVGNLSVGGTGKTPQIEYLTRLLSPNYKIAILSRGYKRKSNGFLLANSASSAEILGDEPFQMHQKFPEILVAVDADRKNGIEQLMALTDKPNLILLDDAYQHRKVKAGFYILLSAYTDLFCDDILLPTGNLRESKRGVNRANVIIITKCPKDLSEIAQQKIKEKIGSQVQVFFSYIDYDDCVFNENDKKNVVEIKNSEKILLAGIAKPEPFYSYLKGKNDTIMTFSDHHFFSEKDIQLIQNNAKNKLIITTEKDYVRLKGKLINNQLYYLPIKSSFVTNSEQFDKTILNYVGASRTNR